MIDLKVEPVSTTINEFEVIEGLTLLGFRTEDEETNV